jgi:DNA-binding transcriptional ArsR family regulator
MPSPSEELEPKAVEVAAVLKSIANERRLLILCRLVEWGEANVGDLAEAVGLSNSAVSQHLAVLRNQRVVDYRRESQTLWYRISDLRIERLFATLHDLFCGPQASAAGRPPARTDVKDEEG